MGQEFVIKSQDIEDKINQLLPSQGGFAPGVDFSASTMVIPIVDLTETAEGSSLRQDLQTALSYNSTHFSISNASRTTIVNTTGYFRFTGLITNTVSSDTTACNLEMFDGTTYKTLLTANNQNQVTAVGYLGQSAFNFIIFLQAGQSVVGSSAATALRVSGITRQIADLQGNLVNP